MSDATITLIVLGATVVLFVLDRIPVAVVAMLVPLSLWATGVLSLNSTFAGFGDPTIVFIASLFVVSEALEVSGVTAWVGGLVMRFGGEKRTRLLVIIMVMVAVLTALITPNGSIAALTPVIVVVAVRGGRSPSELLLPAAFSAHAGSLLMMTGSPVTVVVADYVEEVTGGRLGLFAVGSVGICLVVATIAVVVLAGTWLVPHRTPAKRLRDFGAHPAVLGEHYALASEPTMDRGTGVGEFMVPPRSAYLGDSIHPGMVTDDGALVVMAVHRKGLNVDGPHTLAAGDTLLMRGIWDALRSAATDPDLIAVDDPEEVRRQAVSLSAGAKRAIAILVAMVALLATGLVPPAVVGLAAALALILSRAVTPEQALQGISWTTVILVAGMMALSAAMVDSGAAGLLAEGLVSLVGDAGPYALLAGIFVLTALLGQLISNMATALIVIPIGLSAATQLGISPVPVLIAIAVFAAGALLTPVAIPANLMVMEAAGYRFGDYWKLGLPLLLLYGVAGIFLVPVLWPF